MLLEILLALFIGIFAGVISGLIPGIHINLVGAFLIYLSTTVLFKLNPVYMAIFVVAMAITHTFVDFIPSIFLGCPDTESELSVLPGHEMLLDGKGYEAILLTAYGGIAAIIFLIIFAYPSILFIDKAFDLIKTVIPYLLILASLILIFTEKNAKSIFNAVLVFILTGVLGWLTTQIQFNQPLLPLLSGLFGSSMLIISIKDKIKLPEQKITKPEVKITKPVVSSFLSSLVCGFLPAVGSGQASIIGNLMIKGDRKSFLTLVGATNIFIMGFSFLAYYAISKTRTGASAAVKQLMGNLSKETLILILVAILVSGIIAFFLTKIFAKFFANKISKINYSKISIATIIFLTIIVTIVSGWIGLIVLILSTATGVYCISLNVKRVNMMGCLILPTILFYLFPSL